MPRFSTPAPFWRRRLIDAVYGQPRPWGFLGFFGALGVIWLSLLVYFLGLNNDVKEVQPARAASAGLGGWAADLIGGFPISHWLSPSPVGMGLGALVTVALCVALLLGYPLFVWREWATRMFYRRMYGSYYGEP